MSRQQEKLDFLLRLYATMRMLVADITAERGHRDPAMGDDLTRIHRELARHLGNIDDAIANHTTNP